MSRSSSSVGAAAYSSARRYFLNRSAVTMLTRSSVHCAERMVPTSNSSGFEKFKLHRASGYSFLRRAIIFCVRCFSGVLAKLFLAVYLKSFSFCQSTQFKPYLFLFLITSTAAGRDDEHGPV